MNLPKPRIGRIFASTFGATLDVHDELEHLLGVAAISMSSIEIAVGSDGVLARDADAVEGVHHDR